MPTGLDGPSLWRVDKQERPSPDARILTLGEQLAVLRRAAGLSQRGLARRLQRPNSTVSRWEADLLEPAPWDLYRVARMLGTTAGRLLAETVLAAPPRRWSSRSHRRQRREALGNEIRLRRALEVPDLQAAVLRTGVWGRRLLAIEAGADPSLRELVAVAQACRFSIDAAFRHSVLDASRRPPRSRRSTPAPPSWRVVRTA
jgi:transcriptional regulator with XRE-family HTH domain